MILWISISMVVLLSAVEGGYVDYYGFIAVDVAFVDPRNNTDRISNYIPEVQNFTNIGHNAAFYPTQNLTSSFLGMAAANMKAFLTIEFILFQHVGPLAPSGNNASRLYRDAQARWDTFVALNLPVLTPQYIAAWYLIDEPAWNGALDSELDQAIAIIRSHPSLSKDIPIAVVEAGVYLDQAYVPSTVDWYGFDYYFSFSPHTDPLYRNMTEKALSKMTAKQKYIVVPSTQYLDIFQQYFNKSVEDMGPCFASYVEVAKSQPRTVAVLNYLWPGGFDSADHLGARNLPANIQQQYRDAYRTLVVETPSNETTTTDSGGDGSTSSASRVLSLFSLIP